MSTFYLVLYIFIAVVVLLCLVSFCMYLMHVCGADGANTPTDRKGKIIWRPAIIYTPEEQQPLNQTQLTDMSGENEQLDFVHMKQGTPQNIYQQNTAPVQQHTNTQAYQYQQTTTQPSTAPTYQHSNSPVNYPTPEPVVMETKPVQPVQPRTQPSVRPARPLSDRVIPNLDYTKPPIRVKPMIHSLPSSKRNSLVRPSEAPPPPPPVAQGGSRPPTIRGSIIVKPKAPPPQPPTCDEMLPPPPVYKEVVYDAPDTSNYLSDY